MISMQYLVLILILSIVCLGHCSGSNTENRCVPERDGIPTIKGPRVAIGFYGLSRSMEVTLPSIEKHVFNVLDRQHIAYDVFSHTLSTNTIDNQRSQEHGGLDKFDVRHLRPCYAAIEYQEDIREREFASYLRFRNLTNQDLERSKATGILLRDDYWEDHFASVKNVLCAYHSVRGLYKLIVAVSKHINIKYDAIMVLRPDTAQLIDTDIFHNLQEIMSSRSILFTPSFQLWRGYNDRMAYGSADAMSVYMNRGKEFVHFTKNVNGEEFLMDTLNKYNITVKFTNMRCVRVRIDGEVRGKDSERQYMNISRSYPLTKCTKSLKNLPTEC